MHTRFDTESRIAVAQAVDIARELGHREVGPGHLLVGLLANPRGTAYAALRDHGLDLDTARDLVARHHVEHEPDPDEDHTDGSDAYEDDREALRAVGIDLDRVREAVRANLGEDLADGWAERAERADPPEPRRRRGRGRRGRHHGHHDGHHHGPRGRGRRGPRSSRDDLPFSAELRALLRDVRRSVLRDRLETRDRDQARRVAGMTGARLLVALLGSDDPAARAVLDAATGTEGLRAQAEAAVAPSTT
jgi:hypothetical protein